MSYPATAQPRVAPLRPTMMPRPAAAGAYAASAAQASRYRDAELTSAAPGQLVVMLFDKMLLTIRRAQAAFAAGDIAARAEHICRTADMVTELRGSLDFAASPAISGQLDALYAFVLGELFAANRQQEAARLDAPLRILGELRDAFAGAQAQLAGERPAVAQARSA